jgi:hypothetical protein
MAKRTSELQTRLRALGLDPGPTDGIYGDLTEEAVFDALDLWEGGVEAPTIEEQDTIIPLEWLPVCKMVRVICHWTAGAWKANSSDVAHYHILIEDDGRLVRGSYSIKDNVNTSDGRYAAHTKSCNTESIGVSLCCMAGAIENPFDPGKYPMTEKQWETLSIVVAELCEFYSIKVTPQTVLSHAEVQANLGKPQEGKWDYTRLAFDPTTKGAKECGDKLRGEVQQKLLSPAPSVAAVEAVATAEPPTAPTP